MIGKRIEVKCWKKINDKYSEYLNNGKVLDKILTSEQTTIEGVPFIVQYSEYFVQYDNGELERVHPDRITQVH